MSISTFDRTGFCKHEGHDIQAEFVYQDGALLDVICPKRNCWLADQCALYQSSGAEVPILDTNSMS